MSVDMQNYWYSPGYVISMAQDLIEKYGQETIDKDPNNFRQVGEMKCTAIMLLALNKVLRKHFFMQVSKDQFPDVWTLYQEKISSKDVDTKYQTVEVVTYEPHSNMDVGDFILKSKLINPKKAYDEETIILCYIRKGGTFIDFNDLQNKLKKHKFKPSRVYIIGNKIDYPNIFVLSQVFPTLHHEVVDYIERTKAYPLPHRMFFRKGVTKEIDYNKNRGALKTNPYDVFSIDEKKVREKYKNNS